MQKADSFIDYVRARGKRPVVCFYLHPWEFHPMPQGTLDFGESSVKPLPFIVKNCGPKAVKQLDRVCRDAQGAGRPVRDGQGTGGGVLMKASTVARRPCPRPDGDPTWWAMSTPGVIVALDLEGRWFAVLDGEVLNRVNPEAIAGQSTRERYLNPGRRRTLARAGGDDAGLPVFHGRLAGAAGLDRGPVSGHRSRDRRAPRSAPKSIW